MIYYVDDLADTISFYHSLLKDNGRLVILLASGRSISCSPNLIKLKNKFYRSNKIE